MRACGLGAHRGEGGARSRVGWGARVGKKGAQAPALEGEAGRLGQIFEVDAARAPGPNPLQPLPKRIELGSRRSPTFLKSPVSYQLQSLPFLGAKRASTPTAVNLPLSWEAFNGIGQAVLNSPGHGTG